MHNPQAETVEQRIKRILGEVDITYKGGIVSYLSPEDLRQGRIFSYHGREVKELDNGKGHVWQLTDLESGSKCELIESAQLAQHIPTPGQVFFIRFEGSVNIEGGKRVNNFAFNIYDVKSGS